MKKVGIVILNYKNWQDTVQCVESVLENTYNLYQLIIVDNNSENDSLLHISNRLPEKKTKPVTITEAEITEENKGVSEKIVLIQSHANRGYSAGNNLGIKLALKNNSDYVLILNNDTLVEKHFLVHLVDYMDNHEDVGIAGPKIIDEHGEINHNCARRDYKLLDFVFVTGIGRVLFPHNRWVKSHYYKGEYNHDYPRQVDLISGSCMLIRKEVFHETGLLDENTFLFSEEFILSEKLKNTKMHTVIVPQSQIIHKASASFSCKSVAFTGKHVLKSQYYFFISYKNYSRCFACLLLVAMAIKYALIILKSYITCKEKSDLPASL